MRAQALLAGFMLLAVACGPAGATGEGQPESLASRVAGASDDDAQFSGVLGLLAYKGELAARCTATLVAPDLALTARHCVAFDDGQLVTCGQPSLGEAVVASDVFVTGLTVMSRLETDYAAAAEVIPAPGGDDTCGFDFAALRLTAPPPGALTLHAPRLDEPVAEGEAFTAVGYGSTSGSSDVGTRRYLEKVRVACAGQACALPEVQANEWLAEDDAFCRADSGGAAIDSQGRLIGSVSRGQNPCATPILSAMPAWKDWLIGVAQAAAEAGGYEVPAWASPSALVEKMPGAELPGEETPAEPGTSAKPALRSSCSVALPGTGPHGLLWLALLLSSWWGRRWAAACCGPAIRGGWRARP